MRTDGMTKRQHKKLDAARGVAEPGTEILAYGTGSGNARMSKGFVGLIVGFVALFVVLLVAVHAVLIPGVVLVVVAIGLIKPKRGVAVTPDTVLVFHESMWNGKPNRLISVAPVDTLSTAKAGRTEASRVSLLVGAERVSLKTNEFDRLLHPAVPPAVEHPPT